jgi:hypothetical protein
MQLLQFVLRLCECRYLGAHFHVVAAARVPRERQVVAEGRDLLLPDARLERAPGDLKAAHADDRIADGDSGAGLRMIRPVAPAAAGSHQVYE